MFEKEIIRILKKETKLKEIVLEIPTNIEFGDYAFPCFQLSRQQKRNPLEVALELSQKLKVNEFIETIVPKGPYVNFFVNRARLNEIVLRAVIRMKDYYGSSLIGKEHSVIIEHTSINPNSSPHVGRARNAIIGDALTRLLRFQGYTVESHFFVNDIGKQVSILVYGTGNKTPTFNSLLNIYINTSKKLKTSKKIEEEVFKLLYNLEQGDYKTKNKFKKIVSICVKGQKKILSELGIKFNKYDYESEYLWNNATKEVLKKLEKTRRIFTDEHGRKVLDLKGFGLPMREQVFVLTRKDGTSLYGLRDIAYNLEKAKLGKDRNIVVLGEDQKLYALQINATLSLLRVRAPEVVHYAYITLPNIGKMSTREGDVVLLEEFMHEALTKAKKELKLRKQKPNESLAKIIAYGAVKYAILKVSPEKNISFNWESALSFEGEAAPYIQYAYARACSILKKVKNQIDYSEYGLARLPQEIMLINKLYQFPIVVKKASEELKPNLIAIYAYQLAHLFNEFYQECKVISTNDGLTKVRLTMVVATQQVLKNALHLMGVDAPKRM
ncbi:MAG: arginine--tRNA ligase [Nanoarchaeota archaeon]